MWKAHSYHVQATVVELEKTITEEQGKNPPVTYSRTYGAMIEWEIPETERREGMGRRGRQSIEFKQGDIAPVNPGEKLDGLVYFHRCGHPNGIFVVTNVPEYRSGI